MNISQKYLARLEQAMLDEEAGYRHAARYHRPHLDKMTAEDLRQIAQVFVLAVMQYDGRPSPRALGMARYYRELAGKREVAA